MNMFDMGAPNVIECRYFKTEYIPKGKNRLVPNYELDFNLSGERTMSVNNNSYKINQNSIVFRRPGDYVCSEGAYDMYILSFNFSKSNFPDYRRNSSSQLTPIASDIEILKTLPTYFEPVHFKDYIEIYRHLLSNFDRTDRFEICSALTTKLIYRFAADSIPVNSHGKSNHRKIDNAVAFISEHYAEPITLDVIANQVYLDKSYLARCFKKALGQTPIEFLNNIRITNAKKLIKDTDLSIEQIASLCGFSSSAYFSSRFKLKLGVTPKEYRNKPHVR